MALAVGRRLKAEGRRQKAERRRPLKRTLRVVCDEILREFTARSCGGDVGLGVVAWGRGVVGV